MTLAFVNRVISGGGAERFTVNMANYLSLMDDYKVFILTEKRRDSEYSLNSKIHRLDFLKNKRYLSNISKIIHFTHENNIDILVGIDIEPNLLVCISSLFLNIKCVISERNAPKQVNISKLNRFLRFIFYRFANGYIFQTEGAKSYYSKKIQQRSIVIHNPVKPDLPYKSNVGNKEIIAIGRLNIQKNYPVLFRAFAEVHKKHTDYILRIFGEGSEKEKLETLSKKLGIDCAVKFEGFSLDIHEKIKDSQIFVMTSNFEGMPNALIEAMAMGFPCIATDCPSGGPAELIRDGENGLLVPVGDEFAIANRICELIDNPDLRESLSEKAVCIRKTHAISEIMEKWQQFLSTNL